MLEIFWYSNEDMSEVQDSSVQLVLTSPHAPDSFDSKPLEKYYLSIKNVLEQCYKKLKDDGFLIFLNTDNYRESVLKLRHIEFCKIIESLGFNIFSVKIWDRGKIVDFFRPTFSYIIFAGKSETKTQEIVQRMHEEPFTYDVWTIEGERHKWKEYDAFPDGLVSRCLEVFTEEGDTVLDPYVGTGTTIIKAEEMNRNGIGYEINHKLKEVFEREKLKLNQSDLSNFL